MSVMYTLLSSDLFDSAVGAPARGVVLDLGGALLHRVVPVAVPGLVHGLVRGLGPVPGAATASTWTLLLVP